MKIIYNQFILMLTILTSFIFFNDVYPLNSWLYEQYI